MVLPDLLQQLDSAFYHCTNLTASLLLTLNHRSRCA